MKAICLKKYFKDAVGVCDKVTGKNLSLPILSNILISTQKDCLKLTATNLEIGVEVEIPAKISKEGKLAVPAGIISSFLSNLSGEENITLETQNNNNLLISTSDSSTLIKGQPVDDFPNLPKNENTNLFHIPAHDFISGLKSVWYACSNSNVKPEIASVFMEINQKQSSVVFVATDSFRLAEKKVNCSVDNTTSLLIPYRTVSEILRIFGDQEGEIKISFDRNQVFIEHEKIFFVSRLVDGVFPDYKQILPNKFVSDVVINKDILINSLKTASVLSGKLNELNVSFGKGAGFVVLKTSNQETGEYVGKVPAKVTGDEINISFNYRYILDCLQYITSGDVLMRFSGKDKPLLIMGVNDTLFQYLVMPMNGL